VSNEHRGAAGLQVERTSLAWVRTALSASVVALIVTRYGVVRHETLVTVSGLLLLVGAAAMAMGARRRQDDIGRALDVGRSPVSRRAVRLMTALVLVVSIASLGAVATLR